jgi:hypothetical protein
VQTKGLKIAATIAAPIEHFDLQIDSFSEAIVAAAIEIVQDLMPPIPQRTDERFQGFEFGGFYSGNPSQQAFFGSFVI